MIERYSRPVMQEIWSDESRYKRWLEIEVLACEGRANLGLIPTEAAARIRANADLDIPEIARVEERVKHDVIAFVTVVGRYIGEDASYFHEGLTSSDILDTTLATQMRDAGKLVLQDLDALIKATATLANRHRKTLTIGRTHGIHAEPTSFGLKCAVWYCNLKRERQRLVTAIDEISVGKLSGAVGNFAHLPPDVEEYVCRRLNLTVEPVATQVVQRDRHSVFMNALGLIASAAENIAVEIRHLQRTEVLEAEEPFSKGQRGSSAMPHKRNPILCENITGLARLVRSYSVSAFENITLWHERDISHSSVERVILPDATIALDFLLHRLTGVVAGLVVNVDQMDRNLHLLKGLIFSQRVLLALTSKGVSRDTAYEIVQRNAMKTWDQGTLFLDNLSGDPEVPRWLTADELETLFDSRTYLVHVDTIFKRAGLDNEIEEE